MATPRLVAVVVTCNRLAQLKITLERLLSSAESDLSGLVVFDNASTDGTADWLSTQSDPRLHVIRSASNIGGAGGFEAAMREASARFDPDWLALMDDDARPDAGTLAAFANAPRAQYDAWVAAVRYPDGRVCDMNRPWINPFRSAGDLLRAMAKGRDGFHLSAADYAHTDHRVVDGGSFVGLFLSRAAIARAGFPDGSLFLYGDDVLYSLALSEAGGVIAFDPGLAFEHDCATLSASTSPVMSPLWKVYYYHRNQVMVYRRVAGPILFWPVMACRATAWVMRAKAYGAQRKTYLKVLRQAVRDGLGGCTNRPHESVLVLAGQ
ncbi:glycosyltransferase [Roseovarius confluentis]|uniref:glycosyltransferase n=1 Tax=Roseovarius confluentis TaxID=1852027 RepID=UPI001FE7FC22|nr:glycosyltransferase [Roseovarius confluentis]